jgi:glycosyltransferase involved in cell wall biosynthesis
LDVVVVDDGSTDDTVAVAERWAARDERVRVVSIPHSGRRAALEVAHGLAVGEVLCWVDADDEVMPRGIELCLKRVSGEHRLVWSHRELFDGAGASIGAHAKNRVPYRPVQLLVDNMIFHLRLFTADLFVEAGGVGDLESAIDWDMNLRMAELTSPVCVPRALYRYRVHESRMSASPSQVECGQVAVRRAIERQGLQAELVVDESGWHLRRHSE